MSHEELPNTKLFLFRQLKRSRSSASGNRVRQTADRLRDMPEWLEEFTEGLVDRNSKSSGSEREHPPETPLFLSLYPPTEQEQH